MFSIIPLARSDVLLSSWDDLPIAHALWIGRGLSQLEAACLESFLRAGHRVVLHLYERCDGVPAGVETSDAELVVPRARIVRFRRTGSPALFTNIFRYELLRRGADLWVDTDLFCLQPIPRAPYVFGWENDNRLNNAILALPPDSRLLKALIAHCAAPGIPPWITGFRRAQMQGRRVLGLLKTPEDLPWGSLGPDALTYFAKQTHEVVRAAPSDIYYPLHFGMYSRLFDPGLSIEDVVTSRTRTVHLHGRAFRHRNPKVPASSPLGRLLAIKPASRTLAAVR